MSFLSAGLLAGLVATGIPIALHLLARQQPRRVVFPATRFLKQSLDTHRDRLQVRRWWLLALRMLAIAALAISLARPQINTAVSEAWFVVGSIALTGLALLGLATAAVVRGKSKSLRYGLAAAGMVALLGSMIFGGITMARAPTATVTDTSPAAVAIVFDNSIRTSRVLARDDSSAAAALPNRVIDLMRDAATWMIKEQTSDSLIAIVDRSARPATFSIDHAAALSRIERTEPEALVLPLADRLRAAISLVRSSELERKSVLLITDLTTPSFDVEKWKSAELESLLKQEPQISFQILDVGSEAVANYSLGQLAISDVTPPRLAKTSVSVVVTSPKLATGQAPKTLAVQLDLFDTEAAGNVGLPLMRDSKVVLPSLRSVDRTTIQSGGAATRVLLSVPPLNVGTHHGVVRLVGDDELDADNVRYVTFVVRETKGVLIVAANLDEADVLAGAITAPLAVDDPLAEYKIEISEFPPTNAQAWNKFAAVVFIDPQTPIPLIRAEIDSYLRSGGHLLSLLGPSLTRPEDTVDAFPAGLIRPWRTPDPGTFLEVIRPNHPAVASLREIAGGVPWNAFRVSQYWQLEPEKSDVVIARFAGTNHPAILERTVDPGIHLMLTTPLPALADSTRSWNRLFSGADAWPAFLLIRDMVDSLVHRDRGTHNFQIGESARIPIETSIKTDQTEAEVSTRVQLFGPTGPPVPLVAEEQGVTLTQLGSPGTYWLRAIGNETGLSVNLDTDDTDLSRFDPAKLDELFGKDLYTLVRTREEIRQAEGRGQPTRALYATALLLMLIAFVAEQILSNRFYATRTSTAKKLVVTKAVVAT